MSAKKQAKRRTQKEPDLHKDAFVVCENGATARACIFAERIGRTVYPGLDEKRITAKYVAGKQII